MQESDREALASETFCRHRLLPRAAFSLRRREITISEGPVQGLAGVAEVVSFRPERFIGRASRLIEENGAAEGRKSVPTFIQEMFED